MIPHLLEQLEPRVMLSGGITYIMNGDINRDGIINAADAAIMARMVVHLEPVNLLADLSGDDRVTGLDVALARWMDLYKMDEPFQGRILNYTTPDYVPQLPPPLNVGPIIMQIPPTMWVTHHRQTNAIHRLLAGA